MNILIVGNGFDLAHGLKTKYSDFLEHCEKYINYSYKQENEELEDKICKEYIGHITNNMWIDYFLERKNKMGENWIDLESEISNVIQKLNYALNKRKEKNEYESEDKIESIIEELNYIDTCNILKFKKILEIDLNRVIRALEIYLLYIVEKSEIKVCSPDIGNMHIDKVLSFNYTNTYNKIYKSNVECNFIHGQVKEKDDIDKNNLVLGIDDYTPDELVNKDIEFIRFKKYFQRIHKKTEIKYPQWIEDLQEIYNSKNNKKKYVNHKIVIFGHSLDETDKDILRDLLLSDNVEVEIYYLNEEVYAQQIANLVKVISKEEVIKRVRGQNPSIIFRKQQDMINRP